MGRPATCGCGDCTKCKNRKYAYDHYWRNRDSILAQIKERRTLGEMATYERDRYNNDLAFRKRKKARNMISIRIARGTLLRQPCRECGDANAEAHHQNYDEPLNVIWLCSDHHQQIHAGLVAA